MKKLIVLCMAIIMAVTCLFSFSGAALTETLKTTISISNCDSLTGFSKVDPDITLDTTIKAEGTGSLGVNPSGGAAGGFGFRYDLATALDITQSTYLEFDMYIQDAAALKPQASVYAPLRLFDEQGHMICFAMDFTNMVTGWNSVKLKLSENTVADPLTDWTKIKVLMFNYLYYEGDTSNDANRRAITGLIMNFDNIRLTYYESSSSSSSSSISSSTAVSTLPLTNCDVITGFIKVDPDLAVNTQTKSEGTGSIVINPAAGASGAFGFRYNLSSAVDLASYEFIEFDLYINDKTMLMPQTSVYSPLRLFDSQGHAIIYEMDFTDMQTGWNTVKIDLTETTAADAAADWSNVNVLMFNYLYYEGDKSDDANRRAITGLTMNVDNIRLNQLSVRDK